MNSIDPCGYRFLMALAMKEFFRAIDFTERMGGKLIMGILSLSIGILLVYLATNLSFIFSESNVIEKVNLYFQDYLLFELFVRIIFQKSTSIDFNSLRILPVKKTRLANFYLVLSVFNSFNFLAFSFFGAFFFSNILPSHSTLHALQWLICIVFLIMICHFWAISLKLQIDKLGLFKNRLMLFSIFILVLFSLRVFGGISVLQFLLDVQKQYIVLSLIPILLFLLTIQNAKYTFLRGFYSENTQNKKHLHFFSQGYKRRKLIKKSLLLEFLLMLRNKKPQKVLWTIFFSLLLAFHFYKNLGYDSSIIQLIIGVLVLFPPCYSYGQFFPSFHGKYFSLLMVLNVDFKFFLRSVYWVLSLFSVLVYLLTIPFIFNSGRAMLINFVLLLYNIGVNNYIIIYWGTKNKRFIDLDKSQRFSANGLKTNELFLLIKVFFIPILLFLLLQSVFSILMSLMIFGLIGFMGILFNRLFLDKLTLYYKQHKYQMLKNFKNSS